jgi:hypothetical protein
MTTSAAEQELIKKAGRQEKIRRKSRRQEIGKQRKYFDFRGS